MIKKIKDESEYNPPFITDIHAINNNKIDNIFPMIFFSVAYRLQLI